MLKSQLPYKIQVCLILNLDSTMKAQNQISNVSAIFLSLVLCFVSSCKTDPDITGDPAKLPVITTATSVTNVTAKTAICGGNITDDKGQTVTSRGVCWSSSIDPTAKDSITKDGSGIGTFQSTLKNLEWISNSVQQ
jgi:hypothetical protein